MLAIVILIGKNKLANSGGTDGLRMNTMLQTLKPIVTLHGIIYFR
jgi:hypothetical protein